MIATTTIRDAFKDAVIGILENQFKNTPKVVMQHLLHENRTFPTGHTK